MELDLFHNSQTNESRFKQTKAESQTNETRFKRTKRDSQMWFVIHKQTKRDSQMYFMIHKCILWFTNKWPHDICLQPDEHELQIPAFVCVDFWNFPNAFRFTNAFFLKDILCSLSDLFQF